MSAAAHQFEDDREELFVAHVQRLDTAELLDWRKRYRGRELQLIEDELGKRRDGFSLSLVRKIDAEASTAANGGEDRTAGNGGGRRQPGISRERNPMRCSAAKWGSSKSYPGGKSGAGVYQALIRLMPPHDYYIEPFLGGGGVMKHKRPAAIASFGIDADPLVIGQWERSHHVPNLTLWCGDAIKLLPNALALCEPNRTLIYCDPPYLFSTRGKSNQYRHEFGGEHQHRALLRLLQSLAARGAMILISSYLNTLYSASLRNWVPVPIGVCTRGGPRQEYVWRSFPEATELHDPRYAGEDYNDRWRIKRKVTRHVEKFKRMPQLERQAVFEAICEVMKQPGGTAAADTAGSGDARAISSKGV